MTWFKVDDSFNSHPKTLETSLAAIGLWTLAGSWSGKHLTDGFVPDNAVLSLSRGSTKLADELVAAGLWKRAKGGYRFHQWAADSDGTTRNPTRSEAIAARAKQASGGAIGNHRRWHVKKNIIDHDCPYCQEKQGSGTRSDTDRYTDGIPESHPNRPDPYPTRTPKPPSGLVDHSGTDRALKEDPACDHAPAIAREEPPPQTPLPDDWTPHDGHGVLARKSGLDLEHEASQFRAWSLDKGRLSANWHEAFRYWLGKSAVRPDRHLQVVRSQAACGDYWQD